MALRGLMVAALAALLTGGAPAPNPAPAQQSAEDQMAALKASLPGRLINDPTRLDWVVYGPGQSSKPVREADIPGGGALQVNVQRAGANLYDAGTNAPITSAIKRGQTLVVAFYARTIKADTRDGRGKIGVRFQQNVAPYPGFADTRLDIGSAWKLYEVSGTATADISQGQAVVAFQLAGAAQTIQIAQTIIVEGAASITKRPAAAISAGPATPVLMPQLAAKGMVINDPSTQNWAAYGAGETHQRVAARGLPGDSALQFTIAAVGTTAYATGVNMPIEGAIKQGDVLILAFLARAPNALTPEGTGVLGLRVQKNIAPYEGFGDHMLAIAPGWKLYQVKTQATIDIPAGQGVLGFHLAGARQTLEIGRAYVIRAPAP